MNVGEFVEWGNRNRSVRTWKGAICAGAGDFSRETSDYDTVHGLAINDSPSYKLHRLYCTVLLFSHIQSRDSRVFPLNFVFLFFILTQTKVTTLGYQLSHEATRRKSAQIWLSWRQLCKKLEEVEHPPPRLCRPHPACVQQNLLVSLYIYEIPSTFFFLIKKHVLRPPRPRGLGLLSNQPCPGPTRAVRVSIPAGLALSSMYRYPQRTQGASCITGSERERCSYLLL